MGLSGGALSAYVAQPSALSAPVVAWLVLGVMVVLCVIASVVRSVPDGERLVVHQPGHPAGVRGPGLVLLLPVVERGTRVSVRGDRDEVAVLDATTRDGLAVRVRATVVLSVSDPVRFGSAADEPLSATMAVVESAVRHHVAGHGLADLRVLSGEYDGDALVRVNERAAAWGIRASFLEVTDVDVPLTAGLLAWAREHGSRSPSELTPSGS